MAERTGFVPRLAGGAAWFAYIVSDNISLLPLSGLIEQTATTTVAGCASPQRYFILLFSEPWRRQAIRKRKTESRVLLSVFFCDHKRSYPSAERTGFVPRRKPKGKRSNIVAERYVISFSCSRSHGADAAHGATKKERRFTFPYFGATYGKSALWRREQDLNLRRLLTSHAFQACALNRSTISPNSLSKQKGKGDFACQNSIPKFCK